MKKASRFAALLAAVMLFGSVAATPALAANDDAPNSQVTANDQEASDNNNSDKNHDDPDSTPSPQPNNSGSAYILSLIHI